MKHRFEIYLILLIAFSISAGNLAAQISKETFNKSIFVSSSEVRIDSLLRIFTMQTGVEFSFNSVKISPAKKLSVKNHTQTLDQWLKTLSSFLGIQHKLVGNHIILVDYPGKTVKGAAVSKRTKSANQENLVPPVREPALDNNSTIENTIGDSENTSSIGKLAAVRLTVQDDLPMNVTPNEDIKPSEGPVNFGTPQGERKTISESQDPENLNRSIYAFGGWSRHGSGDMNGIVYGVEFGRYLSRRFSLTYSLRSTMNYTPKGGSGSEVLPRFTTAGVQIGVNSGLSLIRSPQHEFMIKLGAFGRFQSASNGSDGYSLYSPAVTGFPTVLVGYNNTTAQQTFSFGGIFQLQYSFTFNKNIFIGLQPGLQTDTNGDVILQGSVVAGRRF